MAKSLRSKPKRKMRKLKREKNAKRELVKLKDALATGKVVVTEDMIKFQKLDEIQAQKKAEEAKETGKDKMEKDVVRDKKTLIDENGNYPVWMNRKMSRKNNKKKKLNQKYAW